MYFVMKGNVCSPKPAHWNFFLVEGSEDLSADYQSDRIAYT